MKTLLALFLILAKLLTFGGCFCDVTESDSRGEQTDNTLSSEKTCEH